MQKLWAISALTLIIVGCQSTPTPKIAKYPTTPSQEGSDTYHGVQVNDPYRWLENTRSDKVKNWSAQQTQIARSYLDKTPHHKKYLKKLTETLASKDISYYGLTSLKKGFLAIKKQPPLKQMILIYLDSVDDLGSERVLLDPNKIDATGSTTIEWYVPSPSGQYTAVSLSQSGTEVGDVFIYETATGKRLADKVTRVQGPTAGGDLVWLNDTEFLHTRYPHPGERQKKDFFFYQKVYKYKLGSHKSTYELGRQLNKISAIKVDKAPDSQHVLATVQYGDSGRFSYYLRSPKGRWKKIISEKYEVKQAMFGYNGNIFLVTHRKSPRGRLLKMSVKRPHFRHSKVIIAEGKDSLVNSFYYGGSMVTLKSHIVLSYQMGGPTEIRVFDYNGRKVAQPDVGDVSSVGGITKAQDGKSFFFSRGSFIAPSFYYNYNLTHKTASKTKVGSYSKVNFKGVKVVREFATSKDGTQVPVNILLPKAYKKGEVRPLILTGYGGYGLSITPRFSASRAVWLEKGGIYAIANIRGGGEYGKKWHEEGRLTRKQNVFDDFYAVSRHLISHSYTTKSKLGIIGGSNGGLLMGAMVTQHPTDFKAVVAQVGIYDSLRSELSPNGAFNIPEFGTVKKKNEFKALYDYSPYHRVKEAAYPALLLTTGINDNRVDPMHSLKMAAILQRKNRSQAPILLRVDLNTGHGQGDPIDMVVKKLADVYSFFDYQLREL